MSDTKPKAKKLTKLAKVLKWSKVVAKFAAIGTAIAGAITALTSASSTTGLAIGAAGATSYAAAKTIPTGYEKTTHVSPRPVKTSSASQAVLNYQPVKSAAQTTSKTTGTKITLPSVSNQHYTPRTATVMTSSVALRKKMS